MTDLTTYQGCVRSGKGEFAYWLQRLSQVYRARLGVALYPGSLNVELEVEYTLPRTGIIRIDAAETAPYGGSVSVSVVACRIEHVDAFVLRTDANEHGTGDHSRKLVEIAAVVKLREVFHLQDGSQVTLHLP